MEAVRSDSHVMSSVFHFSLLTSVTLSWLNAFALCKICFTSSQHPKWGVVGFPKSPQCWPDPALGKLSMIDASRRVMRQKSTEELTRKGYTLLGSNQGAGQMWLEFPSGILVWQLHLFSLLCSELFHVMHSNFTWLIVEGLYANNSNIAGLQCLTLWQVLFQELL